MCAARRSSSFEIYSGGPLVFGALSVLLFQESFISDCFTPVSGGAISIQLGRLACTDSVIARCSADDRGGAIDVANGIVHLTRSRVEACSAGSAGGVYISGSTSEFIMTDSFFDRCTSSAGNGGALAIVKLGWHLTVLG